MTTSEVTCVVNRVRVTLLLLDLYARPQNLQLLVSFGKWDHVVSDWMASYKFDTHTLCVVAHVFCYVWKCENGMVAATRERQDGHRWSLWPKMRVIHHHTLEHRSFVLWATFFPRPHFIHSMRLWQRCIDVFVMTRTHVSPLCANDAPEGLLRSTDRQMSSCYYWGGLQWMQRSYECKSITAWRSAGEERTPHTLPFTNPIHHHSIYLVLLQISPASPSVPLRLAHALPTWSLYNHPYYGRLLPFNRRLLREGPRNALDIRDAWWMEVGWWRSVRRGCLLQGEHVRFRKRPFVSWKLIINFIYSQIINTDIWHGEDVRILLIGQLDKPVGACSFTGFYYCLVCSQNLALKFVFVVLDGINHYHFLSSRCIVGSELAGIACF